MTDEEQKLVAQASLLGVRFWRTGDHGGWASSEYSHVTQGTYTIARAAAWSLFKLGMMTEAEREGFLDRTLDATEGQYQDVDTGFVQATLSR